MKHMETNTKNRKRRGIVAVLVALALIIGAVAVGISASADSYRTGRFWLTPAGATTSSYGTPRQAGSYSSPIYTAEGGTVSINLNAQSIFKAYTKYFSNVYGVKIAADVGSGSPVKVRLRENSDTNWKSSYYGTNETTFTYASKTSMRYRDFEDKVMALLDVSFDTSTGKNNGNVTLTVTAYSDSSLASGSLITTYGSGVGYVSAFTCTIQFYDYARGDVVDGTTAVDMKNNYTRNPANSASDAYKVGHEEANGYDALYDTVVPSGTSTPTAVDVTPDESGMGKATFNLHITSGGNVLKPGETLDQISYGKTAWLGYQLIKTGENFSSSTPKLWLKDDGTYAVSPTVASSYTYFDYSTYSYKTEYTYTGEQNKNINLYSEAEWNVDYPVTIYGLDPGVTYSARAIVATDGKESGTQYSSKIITFRYDPPVVSSFDIGSTEKVYKSAGEGATVFTTGADQMTIKMTAVVSDSNAVGKTYTFNGKSYEGRSLVSELYFTPALTQDTWTETITTVTRELVSVVHTYSNGTYWYTSQEYQDTELTTTKEQKQDKSLWYKVKDSYRETKNIDSSASPTWTVTVPTYLENISAGAGHTLVDSTTCAFKLVVTDPYTGFTVVKYSPVFTIDSRKPTTPAIWAMKGASEETVLPKADDSEYPLTAGGNDSGVKIRIGPSNDGENGTIRSYEYTYRFLSTDDANSYKETYGSTPADVLNFLKTHNTDNRVSITDWTAATKINVVRGQTSTEVGEFSVAKGGYYYVQVRAIDGAGRPSDVQEGAFVVDLSQPEKPVINLYKQSDEQFATYIPTTYTQDTVWLFAYSEPQTGKVLADFEYSTDNGLTWVSMGGQNTTQTISGDSTTYQTYSPAITESELSGLTQVDNATVPRGKVYQPMTTAKATPPGVTASSTTKYQMAINLKAMGLADYQTIIVRAKDTLGNYSDPSDAKIMRTVARSVSTTATITHDSIEVALALGNTEMKVNELIPNLKNRVAYKMNLKFFGAGTDAMNNLKRPNESNDNKYFLVDGVKYHACQWSNNDFTTACVDPDCPFKNTTYSYYKPEYVNVQGLSEDNSATASFDWLVYTHTYGSLATALSLDSGGDGVSRTITTGLYSQSTGAPGENHSYSAKFAYVGSHNNSASSITYYNQNGSNSCRQRQYYVYDTSYGDILYERIKFFGYAATAYPDFLFLHNDQPLSKKMMFTIDTNAMNAHTLAGGGFWFNTTIRKVPANTRKRDGTVYSTSDKWVLSGWRISMHTSYGGTNPTDTSTQWYFNSVTGGPSGNCRFTLEMQRFEDIDLQDFMDGTSQSGRWIGAVGSTYLSDAANSYFDGATTVSTKDVDGNTIDKQVRWVANLSGQGERYQHFMIATEGDTVKVYHLESASQSSALSYIGDAGKISADDYDALSSAEKAKYKKTYTNTYTTNKARNDTSGNALSTTRVLSFEEFEKTTPVLTGTAPRPTIGFWTIGDRTQSITVDGQLYQNPFRGDSDCYGFGPGMYNHSHGCSQETILEFSDISVTIQKARKLSEVVTEPSWGNGKAKFITNISNDAVSDFSDPVLTSQISWRINNDNTKYVGWGIQANRTDTDNFIKRIAGDAAVGADAAAAKLAKLRVGMYESPVGDGYTTLNADAATNSDDQVDQVAEYMTKMYYDALGFDVSDNASAISTQLSPENGLVKGQVFDYDDVDNINFKVEPEEYMTRSANPDLPAGRWYMVHDISGYTGNGITLDPRSGQYSDALDTNVSLPGRYTYYFAPDADKVTAGTLDPDDSTCVFDFIVNQTPVANFTTEMKAYTNADKTTELPKDANGDYAPDETHVEVANKLVITDLSYDPDVVAPGSVTSSNSGINCKGYATADTGHTTQLTGISLVEWRWEVLYPVRTGSTTTGLISVNSTSWSSTNTPNGKSLLYLATNTDDLTAAQTYLTTKSASLTSSQFSKFTELDKEAVITVYQRVYDKSTRRTKNVDTYTYVTTMSNGQAITSKVSQVKQLNVGKKATESVNPPSATFTMSKPFIYDSAEGENEYITITRMSSHSQGEKFALSWKYGTGTEKKSEYHHLYPGTTTATYNNYYSSKTTQNSTTLVLEYVGSLTEDSTSPIPDSAAPKDSTGFDSAIYHTASSKFKTSTGGQWKVSKTTIQRLIGTLKDQSTGLILQLTESVYGITAEEAAVSASTAKHLVSDASSRTIFYKGDENAPTSPIITTQTKKHGGSLGDYEASSYLDVSQDDAYIQIKIGGSSDSEGKLGGYVFYFYDRNESSSTVTETAWYKYNTRTHALSATTKADALVTVDVNGTLPSGISLTYPTGISDAEKLLEKNKYFTIQIDKNTMRSGKTMDNLNIAIFAKDNASGRSTTTGANETSYTRIQDIKLTQSVPMPTAIQVKNTTGGDVVHISNENGYTGSTGTDVADGDVKLARYSNTAATVSFTPKKHWFKTTDYSRLADGSDPDSSYTEYYEGKDKNADLTNVANIEYYVEYYNNRTTKQVWDYWMISTAAASNSDNDTNYSTDLYRTKALIDGQVDGVAAPAPILPSKTLTFTEDGHYKITARVINGSNSKSDWRTVEFDIDTTPPTTPIVSFVDQQDYNYVLESWAQKVIAKVGGSTDENPDWYEYSDDNGANWYYLADITGSQVSLEIPRTTTNPQKFLDYYGLPPTSATHAINSSGENSMVFRAKDKAGLYSTTSTSKILVDDQSPEVDAPVIEAQASSKELFANYVISINILTNNNTDYGTTGNKVTASVLQESGIPVLADAAPKDGDTEILVPAGGSATLTFTPGDGMEVEKVTRGLTGATMNGATLEENEDGTYSLTFSNVMDDWIVNAYFATAGTVNRASVNAGNGILAARTVASIMRTGLTLNTTSTDDPESNDEPVVTNDAPVAPLTSSGGGTIESLEVSFVGSGGQTYELTQGSTIIASANTEAVTSTLTYGQAAEFVLRLNNSFVLNQIVFNQDGTDVTYENKASLPADSTANSFEQIVSDEDGYKKYQFTLTLLGDNILTFKTSSELTRTIQIKINDTLNGNSADLASPAQVQNVSQRIYTATQGQSVTLNANPAASYALKKVVVKDGETQTSATGAADVDLANSQAVFIPVYSGEGTAPTVTIELTFDISETVKTNKQSYTVAVTVTGHGSVEPGDFTVTSAEDSIVKTGTVQIPLGSTGRSYYLIPDSGYKLKSATISGINLIYSDGNYQQVAVGPINLTPVELSGSTRMYSVQVASQMSYLTNFDVEFERQTYEVKTNVSGNGTVTVSNSAGAQNYAIPEFSQVYFDISPNQSAGYVIQSVSLLATDTGAKIADLGAVSRYALPSLTRNVTLSVVFSGRVANTTETTHILTASADGVRDTGSGLNSQAFQYAIRLGTTADAANIVNGSGAVDYSSWTWTAWTDQHTYTFGEDLSLLPGGTKLQPNTAYSIFVRSRDMVLNSSPPVGTTAYTLANVPTAVAVEDYAESGNTNTKSIRMTVNSNGNPSGTEYLVYYSFDESMSDMVSAKKTGSAQEAWGTLDAQGGIVVNNLSPGQGYFFQIEARNMEGRVTALNKNGPLYKMLSPAAPPANTLWVKEPESPADPVVLEWEKVDANVIEVEIFRNNDLVGSVATETGLQTFSDTRPYSQFADSIVRYSYSYVNAGGGGSAQPAVSEEYYKAVKGTSAASKLTAMQALLQDIPNNGGKDTDLYQETLTYPRYPLILSTQTELSSNILPSVKMVGGNKVVSIKYILKTQPDYMRYQVYDLKLQAYTITRDPTTGDPIAYTLKEDWDADAHKVTTKFERNDQQQWQTYAEWTSTQFPDLDNSLAYQVFVDEVRSTGSSTEATVPLIQESGKGIEGKLGKIYYVNATGYGFWYSKEDGATTLESADGNVKTSVADSKAARQKGTWAANDEMKAKLLTYMGGASDRVWSDPIHTKTYYIIFNDSPEIDLMRANKSVNIGENTSDINSALNNSKVTGANAGKVKTDNGTYVLVENARDSGQTQSFEIAVEVYDKDGAGGKRDIYVSATLEDREKTTVLEGSPEPVLASDYVMPKTDDATTLGSFADPLRLKFDAQGVGTGVYDQLTLKAYDGVTETVAARTLPLVVNNSTPTVEVKSTVPRLLQVGSEYTYSELLNTQSMIATTTPTAADVGVARAALYIMPAQYDAAYGAHVYSTVETNIQSSSAAKHSKAVELMQARGITQAKDTSHTYFDTSGNLTDTGVIAAILCVEPPVVKYVKITSAQYEDLNASEQTAIVTSDGEYWMEISAAVEKGLCAWLEKVDANTVRAKFVDGETGAELVNTHTVALITNFGSLSSREDVDFTVKKRPSATIESNTVLGWTDTHQQEYDYYIQQNYTVGSQWTTLTSNGAFPADADADYAREGDDKRPNEDTGDTTEWKSVPAYRQLQDGTYQVYKVTDTEAVVGRGSITAKIDVELGVNSQFTEVGFVYTQATGDGTIPTQPTADALNHVAYVNANSLDIGTNTRTPITSSGEYTINVTGLTGNTTYFLWTFYNTGETTATREYVPQYTAVTTAGEFQAVYYGFTDLNKKLYEKNYTVYSTTGTSIAASVTAVGDAGAHGTLKFTAQYFLADEFGNFVDANGNLTSTPVEITDANKLGLAKYVLGYSKAYQPVSVAWDADGSMTYPFGALESDIATYNVFLQITSKSAAIRETYGGGTQGHMIVRLKMEPVAGEDAGYVMVSSGASTMDVFVQDMNSPVTEYNMDLVDTTVSAAGVTGSHAAGYSFEFPGLKAGYSSTNTLTLSYKNIGTGDLSHITAKVYSDEACTTESTDFMVNGPTRSNLLVSNKDTATGSFEVSIRSGRPSNIYTGWLLLTSSEISEINPENVVKIKLRQVVGQTTLKGRIYITPTGIPSATTQTGVSYIYVYEYGETNDANFVRVNGSTDNYTMKTDEYGNFEIANLENQNRYEVVVKRDGFVTFDSRTTQTPFLNLSSVERTSSDTYPWYLCLRGGDLTGPDGTPNGSIDMEYDMNLLVSNYNRVTDRPTLKVDGVDTTQEQREAEMAMLDLCDFNKDGLINALDRAYLLMNVNFSTSSYDYATRTVDGN